MLIEELFEKATFDDTRIVGGVYHPYIPLQVYGEPMRYSITKEQYHKFASLIVKECLTALKEAAEDVDNGNIFNDKDLLSRFEESWGAGLYYGIEKIIAKFDKEDK